MLWGAKAGPQAQEPRILPAFSTACWIVLKSKSLLYERNIDCKILGYEDQISVKGHLDSNLAANNLAVEDILEVSKKHLKRNNTRVLRK